MDNVLVICNFDTPGFTRFFGDNIGVYYFKIIEVVNKPYSSIILKIKCTYILHNIFNIGEWNLSNATL